jgi:geranyl-CoA carboxylase alpha subunit
MPGGIRVEHGLESGAEISPYYDSMIAKLISFGSSRDEARRKLLAALEDTVALGVKTNQRFLASCLKHPVFAAGGATTAFIGEYSAELLEGDSDRDARAHALAAALFYATASEAAGARGSAIAHRLPIAFRFEADATECVASLLNLGDTRYSVDVGENIFDLQIVAIDINRVRFSINGLVESAVFMRSGSQLLLQYRGSAYRIQDLTHVAQTRQGNGGGDGKIRAAMNGRVVAVHVAPGDSVKAGQPVLTLEAMKMEHVHAAPIAGRVKAMNAGMGDQVSVYRVIAEIELAEPAVANA